MTFPVCSQSMEKAPAPCPGECMLNKRCKIPRYARTFSLSNHRKFPSNAPLCPGRGGAGIYIDWCITRESPGFRADLQVSRLVLKISRFLTKKQLAKILSVLSKENPYMYVKWEIKKRKSPQFVVEIKEVVQYSLKNWAILACYCSGKCFLTPKMVH